MHIPESVTRAYEEELALIEPLRERAGSRLRIISADNGWLFDDRIKSPESCLSKLEAGHASLRSMHDFYAAMVVVPTQRHVDAASSAVLAAFDGQVKPARTDNPSSFVYDDLHIIASLRGKVSPRAVPHPAVLDRQFEIQIHSGVQYAWWRATHDGLYKGRDPSRRSWAASRASGQARASLELVDGVLADFETAAKLQKNISRTTDQAEAAAAWLDAWPARRRPTDGVRFATTVSTIADAAEIAPDDIASLLENGSMDQYLSNPNITPVQAIIIACHLVGGNAIFQKLSDSRRLLLITEELVLSYSPFDAIPAALRVNL
jgi:hypothetical protein